uniref:RING finger and CHY zinc finger domain-containing protein 1 n=1 Tax=Zooxanthella nutricula TaxID=1333877 RepID=A0A7S2NQ53_9DINO
MPLPCCAAGSMADKEPQELRRARRRTRTEFCSDFVAKGASGCRHYRRRCQIVAPCCGGAYWCRRCHDEAQRGRPNAHAVDRTQIREVICLRCASRQPVGQRCGACGQEFGSYFCAECNFWDDDGAQKEVFHCSKCGICRIGGRENYFHCDTCGSCYPNEIRASHTCVENAMRQNCPVCLQDLFGSTVKVTILKCGHTMHQECLRELQMSFAGLQSLRCPICNLSLHRYEDLWAEMDRQVAETPMPVEYQHVQTAIVCNDCQNVSSVPFHILGHKCPSCSSYNTRRE